MYIAVIVVAIVLGAFILAPRFLDDKDDARALLEKISTFKGIIGLVVLVFSIMALVSLIGAISLYDLFRISLLLTIIDMAALGFVLGFGLLSGEVLSKSENASEKAEDLREKLQPRQEILGMLAIGLAVLTSVLHAVI